MRDRSVEDHDWWYSEYAEFEDFVGIGDERTIALVEHLHQHGEPGVIINRLLKANGLEHGPCNTREA
jgi:hypothetical protein